MVDLRNGQDAGLYRFESVELAANFVIGATLGGIRKVAASKSGPRQVSGLTRMVLLGLGVDDEQAREAIASTHEHLLRCAPGRLTWWHEHAHCLAGEASTEAPA